MVKVGKCIQVVCEGIDCNKLYLLSEVISMLKECVKIKFDESVEVVINLGVDLCYVDQMVCGVCVLLNGIGKNVCVVVFVCGDKVEEVKVVGVDIVGVEELVQEVQGGNINFDMVIVILDMMFLVGCFGKVFGLCGMMLNLKVGIVILDVLKVINDVKGGVVQFCVEKVGIVYVGVGKVLFFEDKIFENIKVFVDVVSKVKLFGVKGIYMKCVVVFLIMGLGVKIDLVSVVGE